MPFREPLAKTPLYFRSRISDFVHGNQLGIPPPNNSAKTPTIEHTRMCVLSVL